MSGAHPFAAALAALQARLTPAAACPTAGDRNAWLEACAAAWDEALWPAERDRLRSAIDGVLGDADLHACQLRRRYGRSYAGRVELSLGGVNVTLTAEATQRPDLSFEWGWSDDWSLDDLSISGPSDLRDMADAADHLEALLDRDGLDVNNDDGPLSSWATAAARADLAERGDA